MKRTKFISITLSAALISVLGLSGCGSSSAPVQEDTKADVLSVKKQGYNVVAGKVTLDESSNSKTRALTRNQADITAYNLSDNTTYRTTSDSSGKYELSGLSDGDYQIFAQNDQYAKNSVRRVTLAKGSRAVVDFSLTAAGSVSGKIAGAGFVYIPGTDHVSVTDADGHFSLTGVPVGTYMLMYEANHSDQRESIEVTITAGAVTAIDAESGFSNDRDYGDEFGYIDTSLELGVLELHHEGIPFRIHNTKYYDEVHFELSKYISLKNSAGEEIPSYVDFDGKDYISVIKTDDIVPAGEYTLTFDKEISQFLYNPINEDRIYKISVEDISVAGTNIKNGARYMSIYLPIDATDAQQTTLSDIKIVEKGTADALTLKHVWSSANQLSLFGSFKTGVEYEIEPTDEQKEILGTLKFIDGVTAFGDTKVNDIYPKDGLNEIRVDQNLYISVKYSNQLDTSTVKFTLNGTEYKGKDILFDGISYDNYEDRYSSSTANISFKHDKLAYDTDYTLTFSAKDISGNSITETTTFKTMSPAITEMEPEDIEDLFDDMQMIEFNVPVNAETGLITIENLTDSSLPAEVEREGHDYSYNPYEIFFALNKLTPNQRYKITASGFKDKDGVDIPAKSTEFSTPPKMLFIPDQYSQNMNVSGEHFNHKVNLFFFGGLTDAEKSALEANLQVKSYGEVIVPDATHPERKLFFIEEDSGTMLTVAFTIDPDTNYELVMSDASGLSGIILPDNTKLVSFATIRKDNSTTDPNAFRVIERFSVQQPYLQEKYSDTGTPSMKLVSNINTDIRIPLAQIPSYESCWNRFENMEIDTNDLANSIIKDSLQVSNNGNSVDVELQNRYWSINENWIENNQKICYLVSYDYEPIASFEADYNKTYEVSLDFTNRLESDVASTNLESTKTLTTAPVGTLEFGLMDGMDDPYTMDSNMIMFRMHSNAPMKTSNIDNLFNVKVNGENYTPQWEYDKNDMNLTTEFSFAVPRTLYSLLQLEISKVDGQDMTFINPISGDEVINNSSLTKPITFVEDVAPDLLPVKVEEIKTASIKNNEVFMHFNRPINLADIATIAEDGTVSDVNFEVKDNDGTAVNITGVDSDFNGVKFTLAEDLNTSKSYTLSLKTGKSIKAAFGAQKLTEFSQEIPLTYIEIGEMMNVLQQGSVSNDAENAYMMGSTDTINANYNNNSVVIVPINVSEGAVVDIEKSTINTGYNTGDLEYDAQNMFLVQPIQDQYNVNVNAKIVYTANNQEKNIEINRNYLNSIYMPYINFYSGNGANAITFYIDNMKDDYQITADNFVVYNQSGEKIDAGITVQFDQMEMSNQPTVTFGSLEDNSTYAIDIVGIPGYDMTTDMLNGLSIDTIFIATPPATQ